MKCAMKCTNLPCYLQNLNLVTPDLLDLYEKKRTELDRRTDQDVATGG